VRVPFDDLPASGRDARSQNGLSERNSGSSFRPRITHTLPGVVRATYLARFLLIAACPASQRRSVNEKDGMTELNFDFITDPRFRDSLHADTAEMKRAFESRSWKSAQVLAGSVVEALLVDYIIATNSPPRPGKDPLKLDLGDAVALCRAENVLSDRTADLSSVIRSYRNLIHPGRVIRLEEPAPSEDSARIAMSVVNLIIEEVARKRRSAFGLTAEQILSKVERDSGSLAILRHLVADASAQQQERLIVDLIPGRFLEMEAAMDRDEAFDDPETLGRLRKAYRILFEGASNEARSKSVARFVRSLREDDGGRVLSYSRAFLRASDLEYTPEAQRAIVVQHLLARLGDGVSHDLLQQITELPRYLPDDAIDDWLDPMIRALLSPSVAKNLKEAIRKHLIDSWEYTSAKADHLIERRFDGWIKALEQRGTASDAELIIAVKDAVVAERLPF
jgi:hypothetical protein